jgi:hypothetical protein
MSKNSNVNTPEQGVNYLSYQPQSTADAFERSRRSGAPDDNNIPSRAGKGDRPSPPQHDFEQTCSFLAYVLPIDQSDYLSLHWGDVWQDRQGLSDRAYKVLDALVGDVPNVQDRVKHSGVYFALGAQREARPTRNAAWLKALRIGSKISWLRALVNDVDVGAGKAHPDKKAARAAYVAFIKASGLPGASIIVDTGHGYHFYWPFLYSISPDQWQPLADALAEATRQHGLNCDTQVTVDRCRILRLPGTMNIKREPVPCSIYKMSDYAYDPRDLKAAFQPYATMRRASRDLVSALPRREPILGGSELSAGIETRPKPTLEQLSEVCPFIDQALRTGGEGYTEPLWYMCLGTARFTAGDENDAHRLSMGHADYDEAETDAKYARVVQEQASKDIGWPSCTAIQNAGCTLCEKCLHIEEGKSPFHFTARQQDNVPHATSEENTPTFFDPWDGGGSPAFPLEALHPKFQEVVDYKSDTIGASRSAMAMSSLSAVIAAIDQSSRIAMTRHTGWKAPPRVWLMLVGDPSVKKSPILESTFGPLEKIDADNMRASKLEREIWKNQKDAAKGSSQSFNTPEPSPRSRLIIRDTTTEKAAEVLSRSNRGTNVLRDELSGFIGGMDRYANRSGGDRAFYLELFNGRHFTKDRVSGEIFIENCSGNIIGGVQPNRLKELSNLETDGMLQRFTLVLVESVRRGKDIPGSGLAEIYSDAIRYAYELQPRTYRFDDAAQTVAEQAFESIEEWQKVDVFGDGFIQWLGKLPILIASLCLGLHVSDAAFDRGLYEQPEARSTNPIIPEGVTRRAMRILREYVIPSGACFYGSIVNNQVNELTRAIASFILTSKSDRFVPSDFTSGVRGLRGTDAWDLTKRLSVFVAGGWLNETGGARTAASWAVAPGLRERFAEKARAERERKNDVRRKIDELARVRSGAHHEP